MFGCQHMPKSALLHLHHNYTQRYNAKTNTGKLAQLHHYFTVFSVHNVYSKRAFPLYFIELSIRPNSLKDHYILPSHKILNFYSILHFLLL